MAKHPKRLCVYIRQAAPLARCLQLPVQTDMMSGL